MERLERRSAGVMTHAIKMWDWFKKLKDAMKAALGATPSRIRSGAMATPGHVQPSRARTLNLDPVRGLFTPGNVLVPAGFLVQGWINAKLEAHTKAPEFCMTRTEGRRILRIVPRSLLGAMWLQFAQTLDGSRFHKPCKECSKWFEVSTEKTGKRTNREFCSDTCKSTNYRRRKAEALELKCRQKTRRSLPSQRNSTPILLKPSKAGHPREKGADHGTCKTWTFRGFNIPPLRWGGGRPRSAWGTIRKAAGMPAHRLPGATKQAVQEAKRPPAPRRCRVGRGSRTSLA